jgi:hypothetical protein
LRERFEEKLVAVFLNRIAARSSWRPSRAMHEMVKGGNSLGQKQPEEVMVKQAAKTLAESQSPLARNMGRFIEDTPCLANHHQDNH